MKLKAYLQEIINKPINLTGDNGECCNGEVKMILKNGKIVCFLINEKYKLIARNEIKY